MRSVSVEPAALLFPHTYIASESLYTITIRSSNKQIVNYEWRKFGSREEEEAALANFDLSDPEQRESSFKDLLFASKNFAFSPKSAELWPEIDSEVVVSYTPSLATPVCETAYLYIKETDERIPYLIRGAGLAPDARFKTDTINVGHVDLDSILEYEVALENIGDVEVDFHLVPHEVVGLIFEFFPEEGHIPIGESVTVRIKFVANLVGSFHETFQFHVDGAVEMQPKMTLYGKVNGPVFTLSKKVLEFGTVGYGFLETRTFELKNRSNIGFDYELRLEQVGNFDHREFRVSPSTGTLMGGETQEILVEFIPISLKSYKVDMYLDILKFGKNMAKVQIVGSGTCPELKLESEVIDMGCVFVGNQYEISVDMKNETPYSAKYEFIPNTDQSVLMATVVCPKPTGIVGKETVTGMKLQLTPLILGPISITQYVKILGADYPPLKYQIKAVSTGPKVLLDRQNIDFGTVNVLNDAKKHLIVKNDSPIPAGFTFRFEGESSLFRVVPEEGILLPEEQKVIDVIANLDDTLQYTSKLILTVQNNSQVTIPIKATGAGTPIRASIPMDLLDFGFIFSQTSVRSQLSLTNHGRRPQEIRWSYQKPKIDSSSALFSFAVQPDHVMLQPHQTADFDFVVNCSKPASFSVIAQCHTTVARKRFELFAPMIQGTFVTPLLDFSVKQIEFKHVHDPKMEEQISKEHPSVAPAQELLQTITKEFNIGNQSPLDLNVHVDCPHPFSVPETDFILAHGELKVMQVSFDPKFKTDFITETIQKQMVVSCEGHPSKVSMNLVGVVMFPNVTFSPSKDVDFGVLLVNTEETKDVVVKNTSEIPVDMVWELLCPDNTAENTKIFDVYPIRYHIDPDEEMTIRFSFFAQSGTDMKSCSYNATAICHIIGGPDYTLNLQGSSAAIQYRIDPLHIDFGSIHYQDELTRKITLQNTSDVPINYSVMIPKGIKFQSISFSPNAATIPVDGMQVISMKVMPGLPIKYQETVLIQIGHFDDIGLEISADCHIPQVQMDVPHAETDPTMQAYAEKQRGRNEGTEEAEPPTPDELSKLECELLVDKLTTKAQNILEVVNPIRKRKQDPNAVDGPVASIYDVDMGNIVFGMLETKEVTFRSISPFPIDVDIKAGVLTDTGFSVTPVQFSGVPTGEELQMTFTFDVEKKLNDTIGDVEYTVPILFGHSVVYQVRLHAHLAVPKLNFSQKICDFGSAIVGYKKVITLQLQNMNYVPCEFSFDEAEPVKGEKGQNIAKVFTANPSSGVLPPSSFLNIEITFEPRGDQVYYMQFPVHINHNTHTYHVKARGEGVQLKLIFDPPSLVMPSVNPFGEPSEAEITISNPTDYPVEFMSQQFDMKLFVEQVTKEATQGEQQEEPKDENSLITVSSPRNTVSKFATCVIVNGPAKSGKTTVCKAISRFLGGVPIVSLSDVWKDLLASEEPPQADDYVKALQEWINTGEYSEGFVIDGLDVLPDTPETTPFITRCSKQKRVDRELEENPFMIFPHNEFLSNELVLSYVLAALNGHYVFHIALKVTEQAANQRAAFLELEKRQQEKKARQQEKQAMFNMLEEQYLGLADEEREDIDRKRAESRAKKLRKALEEDEQALASDRRPRTRAKSVKSVRRGRTASGREQGRSRDKKNRPQKESGRKPDISQESARRRSRKPNDPANIIRFGILKFNFTLGAISKQVSEGSETFKVVDPVELLHMSAAETARDSERDNHDEEEDQFVTHTNFIREEVQPDEKSSVVIQQKNTLLIKATASEEEAVAEIEKFLPTKKQLEEKAFTKLIPAPHTIVPDLIKEKNIKLLPMPTYFKIIVSEEGEQHVERVSIVRPDSHKAKGGRRSRVVRKPKSEEIEIDTTGRTPRWRIEPQSSVKLTVKFSPQLIGEYKDNLFFIVMNGRTDRFKLVVSGVCAHPEIDFTRQSLFPKVIKKPDPRQQMVFVTSLNEFQFGPLLVTKEKPKGQGVYRQAMHLVNPSNFPAVVSISINEKGVWVLEQTNVTIPPNDATDVFFGLNPAAAGIYKAQILVLVADNPEPFTFNVSAEGCLPIIEADCDNLDFGRLLLKQSKSLKLGLRNSGKLALFWHIKGAQQLGDNFVFSAMEGTLTPNQTGSFELSYSSSKPFALKKGIVVEVMDVDKTKTFSSVPVQVTSESFACNFDFAYPKGLDHLNFGSLRVGETKSLACIFKNKGKYPAIFQLASQTPYVTLAPEKGTVPAGKDAHLTFKFMSQKLVKLANEKAAILTVIDTLTNTQTGTLTINLSAATAYSQFVISPEKRTVGFGPVQVRITKTEQFTIQNTGQFAFDYVVGTEPVVPQCESPSGRGRPRSSRKPVGKSKAKKGSEKSATCGPFTIVPCEGTVQPGSTTTIDVDFCGTQPGKACETAIISISDCLPKLAAHGIPMKLKAKAIVPGIITHDYATILSGTPVRMRYQLSKVDQTSFLEDEGILHFAPLILQKRQSVPLFLVNPLPISCIVDVAVEPKDKQGNKSAFPFDVSQKVVELEPNEKKSVDLVFIPVTCETTIAEFTATVRAGTNENTNVLKLQVEGTGTLPIISVVNKDDGKSKVGPCTVNLGRNLVGFTKEKMVTIRNDGVISAKLNITAKPVADFELKEFGPSSDYVLEPGRLLNLPVVFTPQTARSAKFDVVVTPVDNPKSCLNISFVGESYVEDVIFEGLQDDDSDIILKDCIVGRQQEATFRMRNISQSNIRFQWPSSPEIRFMPQVGHLRIGQAKTITVVFFSEKPMKIAGGKYNCQWSKIDLQDPSAPDWDDTMKVVKYVPKSVLQPTTSSRSRASRGSRGSPTHGKLSSRSTSRRSQRSTGRQQPPEPPAPPDPDPDELVRVTEVQPEPAYTVQAGKFKDLQLKISVINDFVKYALETNSIDFSPTMMYQTRTYEVKMSNPSTIRFDYQWRVSEFQSMRTNYAASRPIPFTVQPMSGVIEAGQTTTFKVKFMPEEVDEFVAQLKCEIPFLHSSQPPIINVNAISRRPLCHFCVDTSDYITAGRRLPEYNYELPSDIKVIEIYAGGIGKKAFRRFEIINPTASAYEIEWVKKMPENSNVIVCDTPRALVSSGRRYTITFTYTPESVKTVEFLWEFRIPEHQTSLQFLTVGRIAPK